MSDAYTVKPRREPRREPGDEAMPIHVHTGNTM